MDRAERRSELEQTETLQTIAEIAIALVGFSGIVAVLGRRSSGRWSLSERIRFRSLLEQSLLVVFLSFLPSLLLRSTSPEAAWRLSNGLCGVAHVVLLVLGLVRWRGAGWKLPAHEPAAPLFGYLVPSALGIGSIAIVFVQLLVAIGFAVIDPSVIFEISVLWLLGTSAIHFANLLLHEAHGTERTT